MAQAFQSRFFAICLLVFFSLNAEAQRSSSDAEKLASEFGVVADLAFKTRALTPNQMETMFKPLHQRLLACQQSLDRNNKETGFQQGGLLPILQEIDGFLKVVPPLVGLSMASISNGCEAPTASTSRSEDAAVAKSAAQLCYQTVLKRCLMVYGVDRSPPQPAREQVFGAAEIPQLVLCRLAWAGAEGCMPAEVVNQVNSSEEYKKFSESAYAPSDVKAQPGKGNTQPRPANQSAPGRRG